MSKKTTLAEWTAPKLVSINITQAKITRDDTLHVEYIENYDDATHSTITKDCDQLVHPDLAKEFQTLMPHLVILCDQKGDDDADKFLAGVISDDVVATLQEKYKLTGFSVSGKDDKEGVILHGRKNIGTKVFNFLSPIQKFSAEYDHGDNLETQIEACKNEVQLYLNGKASIKQVAMDFKMAAAGDVED